jgi:hypothetical protein
MALHETEVMPGGGGGRHLTCGLGVSFAGCAVKQGLGLRVRERSTSSRASGGRADDEGCPRSRADGARPPSRDTVPHPSALERAGPSGLVTLARESVWGDRKPRMWSRVVLFEKLQKLSSDACRWSSRR